jgi:hypothetical protein
MTPEDLRKLAETDPDLLNAILGIAKDKTLQAKNLKDQADALAKSQEAARAVLSRVDGPTLKLAAVMRSFEADMKSAGCIGYTLTLEGFSAKPVFKTAVKSAPKGDGTRNTASGGSTSATSVKSVLGVTPEELFQKYASEDEVAYYKSVNNLSTEAYQFKALCYVGKALADGHAVPRAPQAAYSEARRKAWDNEGLVGKFHDSKTYGAETFGQVQARAMSLRK